LYFNIWFDKVSGNFQIVSWILFVI